ncbi:hypothetical protein OOK13_44940 [Streptomyces sp. NBC_00378]|uniref:hypothetical protein n=1 Tax=unclassified Streptomyces TaxID=2593676 RepID=UPI00224D0660|nr:MULTISPECIES: hypothetical protein [unclassified Streptomyces]MCX5115448.1 hypothetical protein [Streptomyces sp. NBC_00378]
MHDPAAPDPQSAPNGAGEPSPEGQDGATGPGTAGELVEKVIAWYSYRMLAERRAGAGPEVLGELAARRRACVEDRDRLEDADAQETARLAALYAALLKDLKSS